jgi:A/G-specific adenine glycosylase
MSAISRPLLAWYDRHARTLPWRVRPAARKAGERPDPYRVWLSEVMLQQTTVATVTPRYAAFLARWPTIEALAAAPIEEVLGEWAGLGYYARARNLHACAQSVVALGRFPDTEEGLRTLPGVGAYTAAAIAAIAFDRDAIVIDGNIERVAARLFAIDIPLPKAKPALKEALSAVWPKKRSGDFAQGLMDLGAGVCVPRAPKCLVCPLADHCEGRAKGIADRLPAKAKKAAKPIRRGIVYALVNAKGEMLFERRPDKGLLGGMLGLPGTEWSPSPVYGRGVRGEGGKNTMVKIPSPPAPLPQAGERSVWRCAGAVTHTFTHFHLVLDVMTAPAPNGFHAGEGRQWLAPDKARLPTVMKKAVMRALG